MPKAKAKINQTVEHKLKLKHWLAAVAIFLLVVSFGYAYMVSTPEVKKTESSQKLVDQRRDRILQIYQDIGLSSEFKLTNRTVFGEKRVYPWDPNRTYASSSTYLHPGNVDVAAPAARLAVEAAGFKFIDEPFPKAVFKEYNFKSAKGEYVRLTVTGKPYSDVWSKKSPVSQAEFDSLPSPNQGPSEVTVKVNLDDNNE